MKKSVREKREKIKAMRAEQAEKTKHIAPPPPLPKETVEELRKFSAEFRKAAH